MCDLLTSGVLSKIIEMNLIELSTPLLNGEEQKEVMTAKGRIELGCLIIKRLKAENHKEEELKEFFNKQIQKMVDVMDPEEVDANLVNEVKISLLENRYQKK